MGSGFVILGVTFFIRDILTAHYFGKFYLFGPQYWAGIPLIPIILLSYLYFGLYVVLTPGFYIRKKSKYMIVFTGSAAIINIVANLILLPRFSIWGAAIATLLSYFTMALSIYLVTQRIYPLPIEWNRVLKIFGFIAIGYVLYFTFNLNFMVRVGFLLVFLIVSYVAILYEDERRTLKAQLAAIFS
jgi:O-antigen/teichoic acid export membrane protein